jgi:hypothetical protein
MKLVLSVILLLLSLSSFSADLDILTLQVGDKLIGHDKLSNQNCSILVVDTNQVKWKTKLNLIVTVGAKTASLKLTEKKSSGNIILMSEEKKKENKEAATIMKAARLETDHLSGNSFLKVTETHHFEDFKRSYPQIDCENLKL